MKWDTWLCIPGLRDLEEETLFMPFNLVCDVSTDASGSRGLGAWLGGRPIPCNSSRDGPRLGVNWKELWTQGPEKKL